MYGFSTDDLVWVMGSFCALKHLPFDAGLLIRQFPPPYTTDSLIHAARALGFRIKRQQAPARKLASLNLPCLVMLHDEAQAAPTDTIAPDPSAARSNEDAGLEQALELPVTELPVESTLPPAPAPPRARPAIVVQADEERLLLFLAGSNAPKTLSLAEFAVLHTGAVFQLALAAQALKDPDNALSDPRRFGFRWFIPELLKHRRVWRDVLTASLIIQVLALGTPLFTQVVIDKVVVHRTESTLIVIGVGMGVFLLFSSLLGWVRQYLILHTGNRVDAVLGAAVLDHLFKLPPRYFEHRPTGVIAARLHGVETIREFVASAAVTLVLDLPFLFIFIGVMFYYSVTLTLMALSLIGGIVVLSLVVAPILRARLNEQFLLGARNQAFVTEYVAGLETVKSLQMEPRLNARYGDYLAEYLHSGFRTRQIGNSYNVAANTLEQTMTTLILIFGAYIVMTRTDFTIGMLVAFQMFASRVSQPMLRLVGLWQQFQQANLSVLRLGDIMNAPQEPYALLPSRTRDGQGRIEIDDLSFRYADNLPFLYQGFKLTIEPGKIVAIMGPSGSGKSTLAKLLQGFYVPTGGILKLDGNDIRHLAANELRQSFGVVPQETILFSGTLYENLMMANPHATFEQVVQACRMAEIHDTIDQLPQGYQTEIGERGVGLSGGQKQRLAIARALLKRPKILIFDEATSALDPATAEHFAATINRLKGKVTMLFISHALPRSLRVDDIAHIGGNGEPGETSEKVVKR
ncbi:MAG: peptidase domain-containing ABC transporter [Candidatus Accumulibacter sp.]|jgi:subfamily B ATP-binding cassette protein HlyB/CyaB|nr:peptidase domain-containing ABC transporter [Accumulibacter sp.]